MEDIVLLLPYAPTKESKVAPGTSSAIAVDALAGGQGIWAKGEVFKNYKRRHACGRYNDVTAKECTSTYLKPGITSLSEGIEEFGPFRNVDRLRCGVICNPEAANINQSSIRCGNSPRGLRRRYSLLGYIE